MDRPLSGDTTDWGYFCPVNTRNRSITIDFDHHRLLSGDNDRFRPSSADFNRRRPISNGISQGRKKKRFEKKREPRDLKSLSRSRSSPAGFSSFAGRGGFLLRLRWEISSPRTGFSGTRRFFSPCEEKNHLPTTRTGRHQAVPLKLTVDGRLTEKSTVGGRLKKKKEKKKRKRRKKTYLVAVLACALPVRPSHPRVARVPLPPAGRLRATIVLS
ncbi:hypothetical protein BHE74_00040764 [Ensete ventricosum]|nr:hypothetical protein BHE74_00040764 [Ensete ventricosum]